MKGETRRCEGRSGTDTMAKRDINGNTYLVVVASIDSDQHSHYVIVYADKVSGKDLGFPAGTAGYEIRNTDYDELVHAKVSHGDKLAPIVSKTVNHAVGELTGHLEETKSQEDAVLGALEANAEVHEE